MSRALAALSLLVITAFSFFVFPGHTYLEQDTQIYVPILENQWSGALANDLIVQYPHVSFTLYDELTNGLRWLTHLPLQFVLEGQQLFFRVAGFAGIFLIALSFGLDWYAAILVTALWTLGATIQGPAVLTIEYEPTPRSFAVPLLLLAVGLALRNRYAWAGAASACAVLLHAPTTWPFLLVAALFVIAKPRSWMVLVCPLLALILLTGIGLVQSSAEHQNFFVRLPPAQEALQRMRASYSYVSTWWKDWVWQYEFFAVVAVAGLWRSRAARAHWIWLGGLVVTAILSVPLSWLLLEQMHLSIVPQVQPARALLFVTSTAVLMAAVTGAKALASGRKIEAALCFLFCMFVSVHANFLEWAGWRIACVLIASAVILCVLMPPSRLVAALLMPLVVAYGGAVSLHGDSGTPDLRNLAEWARVNAHGVYLFPQAGRDHAPGWFRAHSLQPLYVDWKGGGQVNYLRGFSEQWGTRWQQVNSRGSVAERYYDLSIDYLVYPHPVSASAHLVFHNSSWWVYHLSAHG